MKGSERRVVVEIVTFPELRDDRRCVCREDVTCGMIVGREYWVRGPGLTGFVEKLSPDVRVAFIIV